MHVPESCQATAGMLSWRRMCAKRHSEGEMQPLLSIVILNWNVAGLLAGCLKSLAAAAGDWFARSEVLVIDNASTDNSVEMARRDFPDVRLLALSRNLGFSGGNNAGIRAARGKYILLLNPDTVALPGSIEALVSYIDANPEVGIVGPRLLNSDGTLQPSRRRFPTLATALVESTPLQRWLGNIGAVKRFYMLDKPEAETQRVDWLSGAALLCRREALEQAGLFDPGYFMFSEEVDLCTRVNDAGWEVIYLPQAEMVHYGGGSTDQAIAARHINFNTGKARYFRLHEGRLHGKLVRYYLLAIYVAQGISEAAKWLLGHKRDMRAERLRMYRQVLRSGLKEERPRNRQADVLLITGEYPPAQGGVGDYTRKLIAALESKGRRTQVLTRPADTKSAAKSRGVPTTTTRQGPFLARRINVRAVSKALRATGAPIAHIQYQTGAYEMRPTVNFLPWLLRMRGTPTVVTFHDVRVPYLFPKAGPAREWANRVLAMGAAACIATNPEDAARLLDWGVKRLELIPIGSNIPNNPPPGYSRDAWRVRWGATQGTTLLAYFGFLNSSKGLDDLLKALQVLRGRGDYRLLMVGGSLGASDPTNRETAAQLRDLAAQLGVEDSLVWTGYLEPQEVSAALLSADMAVLPYADGASFRRGSLLAVLEHGLPLVTTQPGEQFEQLRITNYELRVPKLVHAENALLVRVGDVEGLARAVEQVAGDAELRQRLAGGASQLARYFGWSEIAERHLELYRDLHSGSR